MSEENENEKERPRSFDEIEKKLKEALARRKGEMNSDVEKEEAQEEPTRNAESVESGEGKEALAGLESISNEFENKIEDLKNKIREHLDKVTQFQKEIETLSKQTSEELEKMNELSVGLEGLGHEVRDRISSIKKEFEEKFKTLERPLEKEEEHEEGVDFGEELARVKKLKDILRKREMEEEPEEEPKEEPKEEIKEEPEEEIEEKVEKKMPLPEMGEETVAAKEEEFHFEIGERPEEMETQLAEMEKAIEEVPLPEEPKKTISEIEEEEEAAPAVEKKPIEEPLPTEEPAAEFKLDETLETMFSGRWKKHWQEPVAEKKGGEVQPEEKGAPLRRRAADFVDALAAYRKAEPPDESAELYYYQHNEKMVLDSESIILALTKHLTEAKKLYTKLAQTGSPREQFFTKQEIIRHQEVLRDVFLRSVRLLDKSSCTLPIFTIDIVSKEFLKEILETLSIENWSNQDDFTFFEQNMQKVKSDFDQRIASKVEFLKSITEELGV